MTATKVQVTNASISTSSALIAPTPLLIARIQPLKGARLFSMSVSLSPSTSNGMTDADVQMLVPTARSAPSRQTERTSTLRPAIRAVPHAWVASNALAYVRPCLARMPKALPARRISTVGTENTDTTTATNRVAGWVMNLESTRSSCVVATNTSGITMASPTPSVSTGSPLDLRSNHTCARVADDVGQRNWNRSTSQSGNPPTATRGVAAGALP